MQIYNEDCIDGMQKVPPHSINLVLTDLPYGVTSCGWDKKLPLETLWAEWHRVLVPGSAVVLTSIQPFTTELIQSNRKDFRYCWYWIKNGPTGFCFANYQPMRNVEDVCVFYRLAPTYHPQGLKELDRPLERFKRAAKHETVYKKSGLCGKAYKAHYTNYPRQTLYFKRETGLHPTQKPQGLFEYFIRTYTDTGETVLDCCMGSGTTAAACKATGRRFIGFEINPEYYRVAMKRLEAP